MRWALEDHLCRKCGGRILRSVSGAGATPGGDPVFMCASCGFAMAAIGPYAVCWCGFGHRNNEPGAYRCLPFSALQDCPEVARELENAFRSCGCDPENGVVGIMLETDYERILMKQQSGNTGR